MRLKFIEPLLPTLVEKPPEGDDWIHEIKFDGYRSQIIFDHDVRIFTRNGHNWTAKYRDLAGAAKRLGVESAIIDGEIVVLNEAGLSDHQAMRTAITRRQHDLYFVAFDLLHLNGHDLRDMALEERREILDSTIPADIRIQFSQALPGEAKAIYHLVDQPGLEGVVSKPQGQQTSQGSVDELAEGEMPRRRRVRSVGSGARGRQAHFCAAGRARHWTLCRLGLHHTEPRSARKAVATRPVPRRNCAEGNEAGGDAMGQARPRCHSEAPSRRGRSAARIGVGFPR
jgi:ATP dependent DNA ligase domain